MERNIVFATIETAREAAAERVGTVALLEKHQQQVVFAEKDVLAKIEMALAAIKDSEDLTDIEKYCYINAVGSGINETTKERAETDVALYNEFDTVFQQPGQLIVGFKEIREDIHSHLKPWEQIEWRLTQGGGLHRIEDHHLHYLYYDYSRLEGTENKFPDSLAGSSYKAGYQILAKPEAVTAEATKQVFNQGEVVRSSQYILLGNPAVATFLGNLLDARGLAKTDENYCGYDQTLENFVDKTWELACEQGVDLTQLDSRLEAHIADTRSNHIATQAHDYLGYQNLKSQLLTTYSPNNQIRPEPSLERNLHLNKLLRISVDEVMQAVTSLQATQKTRAQKFLETGDRKHLVE